MDMMKGRDGVPSGITRPEVWERFCGSGVGEGVGRGVGVGSSVAVGAIVGTAVGATVGVGETGRSDEQPVQNASASAAAARKDAFVLFCFCRLE